MARPKKLGPIEALTAIQRLADDAHREKERHGLAFAMVSAEDIDHVLALTDQSPAALLLNSTIRGSEGLGELSADEEERGKLWFSTDPLSPPMPERQRHRSPARRSPFPRRS